MKQTKLIGEIIGALGIRKKKYDEKVALNRSLDAADEAEDFGLVIFEDQAKYNALLDALNYFYEVTFTAEQEADYENDPYLRGKKRADEDGWI